MSPAEVKAAYPNVTLGNLADDDAAGSDAKAFAHASSHGFRFKAVFGFGARDRLNRVALQLSDPDECFVVRDTLLRERKWIPFPDPEEILFFWASPGREQEDSMAFLIIGSPAKAKYCNLTYEPYQGRYWPT
jgi:hypothetical protein